MNRPGWLAVVTLCLGLVCGVLLSSGCLVRPRAGSVAPAAEPAAVLAPAPEHGADGKLRFTDLVPVALRCGDDEGTPLDGHVRALDASGNEVQRFSFSPGKGVTVKSYATGGLPGGGEVRVYAPEESCRNLRTDVVWVTAHAENGETAQAQLPVTIGHGEQIAAARPPATAKARKRLVIADFDCGKAHSRSGQPLEEWFGDEACRTRFTVVSATEHGGVLRLTWDNAPAPHYSGMWLALGGAGGTLDASGYQTLSLDARGSTDSFGLELKDDGATPGGEEGVGRTLVTGVRTQAWTTIRIPLEQFERGGDCDRSRLRELAIAFADGKSARQGELLLDNLAFE